MAELLGKRLPRGTSIIARGEAHLIPTFVMARRIQLMAWITSHDDSDPVKVYYRGFAGETVKMGERFLLGNPDFFQLYQEN